MKKWLVALAALVIVLAAGVLVLILSLNGIVEKAVNEEGPKYTGTSVHLDKADISLFSGTGTFSGFTLGNPEGFSGPWAAKVDSATVTLDTGTVLDDTIVIPGIVIDSPELVYELGNGTSNFDAILRNVKKKDGGNGGEGSAPSGLDGAENDRTDRKVIIDELVIRHARTTLSIPQLKLSVTVPLPDIRLTDIGRKSAGATIAEASAIVLAELTRTLSENAADQTKDVGKLLLKGGEGAAEQAKNAGSALLKGGENAGDAARNLLKEGLGAFRK